MFFPGPFPRRYQYISGKMSGQIYSSDRSTVFRETSSSQKLTGFVSLPTKLDLFVLASGLFVLPYLMHIDTNHNQLIFRNIYIHTIIGPFRSGFSCQDRPQSLCLTVCYCICFSYYKLRAIFININAIQQIRTFVISCKSKIIFRACKSDISIKWRFLSSVTLSIKTQAILASRQFCIG